MTPQPLKPGDRAQVLIFGYQARSPEALSSLGF
jgi:hypothetical protein